MLSRKWKRKREKLEDATLNDSRSDDEEYAVATADQCVQNGDRLNIR